MQLFNAPRALPNNKEKSIFLAGTIDNGNSFDWQEEVTRFFCNAPYNILNPRRKDWDESWQQKEENREFAEQVNWELDALEKSDLIIMNFLPRSQSPVTLLEFGLFARSQKLMVCCPDEFWRSGNVYIACQKYGVPVFRSMDELLRNIQL